MSEITFLDGISPCEVHGHTPTIEKDWYTLDIIGTKVRDEKCTTCGKTRSIIKHDTNVQLSATTYPDGKWV